MTSRLCVAAAACVAVLGMSGCSGLPTPPSAASPSLTAGASRDATPAQNPQNQAGGPADWADIAEKVSPAVVAVSVRAGNSTGQGSGVVIDDQGHIVTNHHVVAGPGTPADVAVTLWDNRVVAARVVGTDPASDLAVLQVDNANLAPLPIGDDSRLRVGDPVLAVGNPLGLAGTVTSGMVSALNRPVTTVQGGRGAGEPVVTNAVQTDAAINPGNSGGALVNSSGELVGINSSIATMGEQSGSIGIGFAITATQTRNIVEQLIATGSAQHSYLGVVVADTVARVNNTAVRSAAIARVEAGTPAADAGLRQGDAVIAIDGEDVDSGVSLTAQVRERTGGSQVRLSVARDGAVTEIPVTLASRP